MDNINELEDMLDKCLDNAEYECDPIPGIKFETVNLMPIYELVVTGASGCGKTSRIEEWARKNKDKINFVSVNAGTLKATRFVQNGKKYPIIFPTDIAKKIMEPKTVLFIDDYQLIDPDVDTQLQSMISTRTFYYLDGEVSQVHLDEIYFVVKATSK